MSDTNRWALLRWVSTGVGVTHFVRSCVSVRARLLAYVVCHVWIGSLCLVAFLVYSKVPDLFILYLR